MRDIKLTYFALSLTFFIALSALVYFFDVVELEPFSFLLLALAVLRLGRLVAFDKVFNAYREPFTQVVIDDSGAGETVIPRGTGVKRVIGELLTCPICAGTWVALMLLYGLVLLPEFTYAFVLIMALAGSIELFHALTEAIQWTGEAAREESA